MNITQTAQTGQRFLSPGTGNVWRVLGSAPHHGDYRVRIAVVREGNVNHPGRIFADAGQVYFWLPEMLRGYERI